MVPHHSHPGHPGHDDGPADGDPQDRHVPVMADRIVALLAPALGGDSPVLVDATLGLGGHAIALLEAFAALRVIGLDRDRDALAHAESRVRQRVGAGRLIPVHAVYDDLPSAVAAAVSGPIDAVLFDLGVSSMQLDRADRGFAYAQDAPLDMRMDQSTGHSAADVLNTYTEADLTRILRHYGEERFAARIARTIVLRRARQPLRRTGELVDIVRSAIPAAARRSGGHPAKRTFQALRIEVNDELGVLRRAVPASLGALRTGGRIAVLSYHSLEDRIVKRAIAPLTVSTTPLDLPVELPGGEPSFRWIMRGAETPTDEELRDNPRAASARLRAAERLRSSEAERR